MNTFLLSPCGISTLLSGRTSQERSLLLKHANVKSPKGVPPEELTAIENIVEQVKHELLSADLTKIRQKSAELRPITLYYGTHLKFTNDVHYLLSTDTWLGEVCTGIIQQWLNKKGASCISHRQEGLQTNQVNAFHNALAELAPQLINVINGYKTRNYHVVFNLTAGFKAVQGFLQTLGMFHANELVYVFEGADQLMHIPRMPIRIDGIDNIRSHLNAFRKLALGLSVQTSELTGIPETMLLNIEDEYILSAWGNIFWQEAQKILYSEKIYPSIHNKVKLSNNFQKDIKGLPPDRLYNLNKSIDLLYVKLIKEKSLNSLGFKELKGNPVSESTHEFYAWSDKDAKRCFCHFEDGCLIVDHLEKHL